MVARTLPAKVGRICEISFQICRLPRWLEDAVDAAGMQRMKDAAAPREAQRQEMGGEAAGTHSVSL